MPLTSVYSAHGHATTPTKAAHDIPPSSPRQQPMACPGTPQGKPWHTPKQAMACHDTHQINPSMLVTSVCSAYGHATVPTETAYGHLPRPAMVCHDTHKGSPRHATKPTKVAIACHSSHQGRTLGGWSSMIWIMLEITLFFILLLSYQVDVAI
jgi:hypothetical protein